MNEPSWRRTAAIGTLFASLMSGLLLLIGVILSAVVTPSPNAVLTPPQWTAVMLGLAFAFLLISAWLWKGVPD